MFIIRRILLVSLFFIIIANHNILAKEVPYTLEDRDRLLRIEERMVTKEELKAEINGVRSEINGLRSEMKSEINGLRSEMKSEINGSRSEIINFMLWGFGVTFAGIFTLIGFVLWDRRTALVPAIRKNKELEEREKRIEEALREIALNDPNVSNALKHVGLL